jgi:hypothetical protein
MLKVIASGVHLPWDMRGRTMRKLWTLGYICRAEKQWASLTVKGRREVERGNQITTLRTVTGDSLGDSNQPDLERA